MYYNEPAWAQRIVWGDRFVWGDRLVWGDMQNVVWDERIVWGDLSEAVDLTDSASVWENLIEVMMEP